MQASVNHTMRQLFLENVQQTDGCWLWTGNLDVYGYGRVRFNRRTLKAHRVAYELFRGEIPDELLVLHECDNNPCVRPDHLFLGTTQVNTADCVAKDRHTRRERNGRAKITLTDAEEIRRLYAQGDHTQQRLGVIFQLNQTTISAILRGLIWKSPQ